MSGYRAALFAPDGEYVTDYAADTVAEVWARIEDGGSRWFFYPFPVVIRDHAVRRPTLRIVETPDGYPEMKGRTLLTFARILASMTSEERQALYDGIPLAWIMDGRWTQ